MFSAKKTMGDKKDSTQQGMEEGSKDGGSDLVALIKGLETRLDDKFSSQTVLIESVKTHLDNRITELQTLAYANKSAINKNFLEIANVTQTATTNSQDIAKLEQDVHETMSSLQQTNTQLKTELNSLHNTVSLQAIKLNVQRRRTEDQTNRALRKTLIIRGIPEPTEDINWSDTRKTTINALADATKLNKDGLNKVFERIHRGKKFNKDNKYPRHVHALLFDWNAIESIRKELIKHGKNSGIYIDNHYGPDTTYRRSKAFDARRTMKAEGTIHSAYVAFPARLFVKYKPTDTKYVLYKNYSNIPAPLPEEELQNYEPLLL